MQRKIYERVRDTSDEQRDTRYAERSEAYLISIRYEPQKIERKWRRIWEERKDHKTSWQSDKPKYYCLDMFPYPSGSGLHVGHWRGYVLSDVWARYKKLQGYNVLHPMGWDSFGLPTENDAIKKGIHPKINTQRNIENMRRQLKEIGAMYDWSREINTSDPQYYKWTQWIFLQMYKNGLAYRKLIPINWCPSCKTGLANEEVINGRCERCNSKVTRRNLMQWMLKITKYAHRLLRGLDKLNWPQKVKTMQANWIGYSQGAEVIFKVNSQINKKEYEIPVFTTRPDTLFGATYMVLAPEHKLVPKIISLKQKKEVVAYVEEAKKTPELARLSLVKEKTGIFTGTYAINPVNKEKIPIWISDYVLLTYGTGAIMAVPAHDRRDFEFAKEFSLPIREVIYSKESKREKDGRLEEAYIGEGKLINSGEFNGLDSEKAREKITQWLAKKKLGKKSVNYKLRDWVFSRQRYWGEPIPIIYCSHCGEVALSEEDLPVKLPQVEKYKPTGSGKSPLENITHFVNTTCPRCGSPAKRETDTMPNWAGSSWYFLRYPHPHLKKASFDRDNLRHWLPVDMYVGGIEHAILHLLYARFFTKVLYDLGYIDFEEPFEQLFNQGMVCKKSKKTGKVEKMSKSKGNVVTPDILVNKYGTDTVRMYELFIGPAEMECEWTDQGIEGIYRFLKKTWDLFLKLKENFVQRKEESILRKRHSLIRDVTEKMKLFKFNTAISSFMEFLNWLSDPGISGKGIDKKTVETFLILLAPFAPHFSEELWEMTGHPDSIFKESWPEYDSSLAESDTVGMAIQINGKLRGTLRISKKSSREEVVKKAKALPAIEKRLKDKNIKKTIFVPGKIINFVISN